MPAPAFGHDAVFDPELHLHFNVGALDPVRADAACEFVLRHLALPAGSRIFDLACGHGRHLMIDSVNRDNLARRLSATSVEERAGSLMIDRRTCDARAGRVLTARIHLHQGRRVDAPFFVRICACSELAGLLDAHGLAVGQVLGGVEGAQLSLESPRMVVLARKR